MKSEVFAMNTIFRELIINILKGVWEFCKYLFLTPSWGSKRRAEQREYEERLDEAMKAKSEDANTNCTNRHEYDAGGEVASQI